VKFELVKWDLVLEEIDGALGYFESQGVKPTLRTLFYYLVSKNMIPNTRSAYKSLSRKLVQARKKGRYEWDFLEDKTRVVLGELGDSRFDDDVIERFEKQIDDKLEELDINRMIDETFDYLKPWISVSRWAEQPTVPEVWIEKEALASTLESWLSGMEIPIRVNRGYSSWTFIYNNVRSLKWTLEKHEKVVIFYCGDLDPSGLDIERFLQEALEYFGLPQEEVEFRRLAVTSEQVERFSLPPRPEDADTLQKLERDPRYKSYREQYIVELDALVAYAPSQFRRIVVEAADGVWDREIYEKLREKARKLREKADKLLDDIKKKAKEKILKEIGGE